MRFIEIINHIHEKRKEHQEKKEELENAKHRLNIHELEAIKQQNKLIFDRNKIRDELKQEKAKAQELKYKPFINGLNRVKDEINKLKESKKQELKKIKKDKKIFKKSIFSNQSINKKAEVKPKYEFKL